MNRKNQNISKGNNIFVKGAREHNLQNIDVMNLAGFCRNCLSKWYMAAGKERGIEMEYDQAQEIVYGMPYAEWKEKYQKPASEEQKLRYEETKPLHAKTSGH